MKILILSDINSAHTEKWVKGLCSRGISICLFSFSRPVIDWYSSLDNFKLGFTPETSMNSNKIKTKLSYFAYLKNLKRCISQFEPDVLHSHYASSYGLIGKLSGFHPFIVSVWGADVYDFPNSNWINKTILKKVFKSADKISSTSLSMGIETNKYTEKTVKIIPFGIRLNEFSCDKRQEIKDKNEIVIGNIKSLSPKYGTKYLIEAFQEVSILKPELNLKLLLVGGGSHLEEYKKFASSLGLEDKVEFTGFVGLNEVPKYHCKIDIFVSLSVLDSESFGVSLVEAMASKSKVVASKVSGFKEVLRDCNDNGIMVEPKSVKEATAAILQILNNPEEATERANNAYRVVEDNYEWDNNLTEMIKTYNEVLNSKKA